MDSTDSRGLVEVEVPACVWKDNRRIVRSKNDWLAMDGFVEEKSVLCMWAAAGELE